MPRPIHIADHTKYILFSKDLISLNVPLTTMSDRHPWSVYAEQLTPAGHGFPVYFPEHPWQEYQQPAQIGDVGIIINGKFKPFFNVVDKRSPVNTDQRLPHKYEELVYDRRLNDHTDGYLSTLR